MKLLRRLILRPLRRDLLRTVAHDSLGGAGRRGGGRDRSRGRRGDRLVPLVDGRAWPARPISRSSPMAASTSASSDAWRGSRSTRSSRPSITGAGADRRRRVRAAVRRGPARQGRAARFARAGRAACSRDATHPDCRQAVDASRTVETLGRRARRVRGARYRDGAAGARPLWQARPHRRDGRRGRAFGRRGARAPRTRSRRPI